MCMRQFRSSLRAVDSLREEQVKFLDKVSLDCLLPRQVTNNMKEQFCRWFDDARKLAKQQQDPRIRQVKELRKLKGEFFFQCADHEHSRLVAYCPSLYNNLLLEAFTSAAIFSDTGLTPEEACTRSWSATSPVIKKQFRWAFTKGPIKVPGGYVLPKAKKNWTTARSIVTYAGWHAREQAQERDPYYHGRFVRYPYENGLGDLPKEDNFECLSTYIEADFARRQGAPEPQNFRDWCHWRFGAGISRTFMHPYNEKIWKTDLADMSINWVSGRVPDAPVSDVIRASIGIETEGYKHQSVFWYPLTGGFESIVKGIAGRLDQDRLHVGTPVTAIEQTEDGYTVNGEHFDKVISTIPLQQLARTLSDVPEQVQEAFDGLSYTGVLSILVALDTPPDTDRSWIYFPHPENGPFNRVTHISNYSPQNAPAGKSALMAEVTYKGDIDAEAAERDVVDGLVRCGFAERDKVLFSRSWKNKYAYIVYSIGLEENLAVVREYLSGKGIDLLGRFGNYNYFNSDQCIESVMEYVDGWNA